nr:hypothetical protein CFP56_70395 [Quercus suber]
MDGRDSLDKGRGDNDSGAKVASEQIDVKGNIEPGPGREDGEKGHGRGDDENDEDGGNAHADRATVLIVSDLEGADDLAVHIIADISEIDIGSVKSVHFDGGGRDLDRQWARKRAEERKARGKRDENQCGLGVLSEA